MSINKGLVLKYIYIYIILVPKHATVKKNKVDLKYGHRKKIRDK